MNTVKNKKLPKWSIGVIILSFILNIAFIALFIAFAIIDSKSDIYNDLVINQTRSYYNEVSGTYIVTGVITNKSFTDYDYVTIRYTMYDENDNIIGTGEDYLEELDEGETWRFAAEYYGINAKEISYYELTTLEGY